MDSLHAVCLRVSFSAFPFSGTMNWNQSLSPHDSSTSLLSSPIPQSTPTNDDIEAVIQSATSASKSVSDTWLSPARDTRTQIFVGNLPYRVRWQDVKDLFRKAGTVLRADVSLGPDNRSRGYGTVLYATAEDANRAVETFNGYSWQTRILEVRPDRQPTDVDSALPPSASQTQPQLPQSLPAPPPPLLPNLLPSLISQPNPLHAALTGFAPHPPPELQQALARGSLYGDLERSNPLAHDLFQSNQSNPGYHSLFVGNLPFHCQWQDLKDLFRQAGTILRADVALGPEGRSRGFGTVAFANEVDAERAVRMFHGFEYNGRTLKVHHDKLHQAAAQIVASPASPASSTAFHPLLSMGVNAPASRTGGVSLPSSAIPQPVHPPLHIGLRFDQNSSSSSSSGPVFERYQRRTSNPQLVTRSFHSPTTFDSDNVTSLLATTRPFSLSSTTTSSNASISRSVSTTKALEVHKPAPIPAASDSAMDLTASPTRPAPSEPPKRKLSSAQHNPHHPGTIRLPPLPPLTAFTPPFGPHGMTLISPLHHASVHMTSHDQAAQLHHPPGQITPHGLPPITPSMPPFTLSFPLPSPMHIDPDSPFTFPPLARPHEYASQQSSIPASSATATTSQLSSLTSSVSLPGPQPPTTITTHSPTAAIIAPPARSQAAYMPIQPPPQQNQQQQQHVQYTHLHQQFTRQHMGSFSPGLVMSPGTIWGGPGAHPNPSINPVVGAPVHRIPPPPSFSSTQSQPPPLPPPSSHQQPQQDQQQGISPHTHQEYAYGYGYGYPQAYNEPKEYFDPNYFPLQEVETQENVWEVTDRAGDTGEGVGEESSAKDGTSKNYLFDVGQSEGSKSQSQGRQQQEDNRQASNNFGSEAFIQETLAPIPIIAVAGAAIPHSPVSATTGLIDGQGGHVRSKSSAGDDLAVEQQSLGSELLVGMRPRSANARVPTMGLGVHGGESTGASSSPSSYSPASMSASRSMTTTATMITDSIGVIGDRTHSPLRRTPTIPLSTSSSSSSGSRPNAETMATMMSDLNLRASSSGRLNLSRSQTASTSTSTSASAASTSATTSSDHILADATVVGITGDMSLPSSSSSKRLGSGFGLGGSSGTSSTSLFNQMSSFQSRKIPPPQSPIQSPQMQNHLTEEIRRLGSGSIGAGGGDAQALGLELGMQRNPTHMGYMRSASSSSSSTSTGGGSSSVAGAATFGMGGGKDNEPSSSSLSSSLSQLMLSDSEDTRTFADFEDLRLTLDTHRTGGGRGEYQHSGPAQQHTGQHGVGALSLQQQKSPHLGAIHNQYAPMQGHYQQLQATHPQGQGQTFRGIIRDQEQNFMATTSPRPPSEELAMAYTSPTLPSLKIPPRFAKQLAVSRESGQSASGRGGGAESTTNIRPTSGISRVRRDTDPEVVRSYWDQS